MTSDVRGWVSVYLTECIDFDMLANPISYRKSKNHLSMFTPIPNMQAMLTGLKSSTSSVSFILLISVRLLLFIMYFSFGPANTFMTNMLSFMKLYPYKTLKSMDDILLLMYA